MGKKKELWTTFRGNNKFPIYNWFYFTEAFSRGLVRNIILKYKQDAKNILDPFCGTGTTLLVAKEFNIEGYGLEISPLMYLIAKVKTNNYKQTDLKTKIKIILKKEQYKIECKEKWIKKYFYADNLRDLLNIREHIHKLYHEKKLTEEEKDFFLGVLIKTLQTVTKAEKHGASLKIRKIKKLDVYEVYKKHFINFIKDLEKFDKKYKFNKTIHIYNDSVSNLKNYFNNIDLIVTSPPYPNKTEYVRRFGIELAFLNKKTILEKHLGTENIKKQNNYLFYDFFKHILNTKEYKLNLENYNLENYFIGLENFIQDAYDVLNNNGIIAITIAGGCFKSFALDITNYMIELLKNKKFKVIDLKIDREIICHKERTKKIGKINEFTIIAKKGEHHE